MAFSSFFLTIDKQLGKITQVLHGGVVVSTIASQRGGSLVQPLLVCLHLCIGMFSLLQRFLTKVQKGQDN